MLNVEEREIEKKIKEIIEKIEVGGGKIEKIRKTEAGRQEREDGDGNVGNLEEKRNIIRNKWKGY